MSTAGRWRRIKAFFHEKLQGPVGDAKPEEHPHPQERSDSTLTNVASTPTIFASGDLVCRRYVIIKFIARGGMGEVYEVQDNELETRVALKALMSPKTGGSYSLDRFRREILLARTVTHPNVCRVFDVGHDEDPRRGNIFFLTMELLRGETLAQYLAHERCMSWDDARPLVRQMIDALSAAHRLGVIHRDFKPGNVMLVNSESGTSVKVTDFGLAKSVSPDETAPTTMGEILGTPDYMAPEQFQGQCGKETDVYALGLTIFRMVMGGLPISRVHPLKDLPRPSSGRVEARLRRVLLKCLASDPSERFHDVDDVWRALSGTPTLSDLGLRTVAYWKRPGLRLGVALILILITLGLMRSGIVPNPFDRLPKQKHIAVLTFRTIGNDASSLAFADGIVESLTSKLSQLERYHESLWIVPSGDSRNIKSLDDAYRSLNVNLAITGSIQQTPEGVDLTANLVDAEKHKQLASRSIHVATAELESLQDRVWESVAEMVDLEVDPRVVQDIAAGGTRQPGAYRLYVEGIGHLRQGDFKEVQLAIESLRKAITIDPEYALAYADLGNAYVSDYFFTKNPASIEQATQSVHRAIELNDRLVAVHITLGRIYQQSGQLDRALAEFHYALKRDPSEIDAQYDLADIYAAQGKNQDAEAAYKAVISRTPRYWLGYSGLGTLYYNQGDFVRAAEQFKAVIDYAPNNAIGYQDLGGAYLGMGKYDEAVKVLTQSISIKETPSTLSNLGSAYMYLGRYQDAANAMLKAATLDPQNHVLWRNLGDSYRQLPSQAAEADKAYEKAAEAAQAQLEINPTNSEALGGLALYQAHLDRNSQAETNIAKALALAPKDSDLLFTSALVYELIGQRDRALTALDQAVKAGFSREEVEREPELRALRSDPRYK
jgi:eukaryotic-like serine/threonine-protein kinase